MINISIYCVFAVLLLSKDGKENEEAEIEAERDLKMGESNILGYE